VSGILRGRANNSPALFERDESVTCGEKSNDQAEPANENRSRGKKHKSFGGPNEN